MTRGPGDIELAHLTTEGFRTLVEGPLPVVVLVPVGSVEPHGPHLPLATDGIISRSASRLAAAALEERGLRVLLAPEVPYGVTECAAAFKGAVSVTGVALVQYLISMAQSLIDNGVTHVCLVNNHLEPGQAEAVRNAARPLGRSRVSVACPLDKRWARVLSDEFRSGACHAGCYETSIVLAAAPELVEEDVRRALPDVNISLSEMLGAGVTDFVDMGLSQAYAGAPARATAAHGREQLALLARMILTEVTEALGESAPPSPQGS